MNADLERQVESLFHELADLPPLDRERALNERTGGIPEVRQRVERLLALHDASCDPGLRTPVHSREHQATAPSTPSIPERIGHYEIVRLLGEGGMGVVYLAEQTEPIHRRVALKIIRLGMDTQSVIARFETERESLALMNHPNVARVIDAGATEQGRPYFVMEYVEGTPITEFCDKNRLALSERLHLFMQVCQAVQHAHQKGIIHRDLKPSNVLVTQVDQQPAVKVIDFGIAKATQQKLTEHTFATERGILVGTPAYMSPEQADPLSQDIDTRADIYSLGVILYELLVGALPLDPDAMRKAALSEIQRLIREVDPPKPSTRVRELISEPRASASGRSVMEEWDQPLPHGRGSVQEVAHSRNTDPKSLHRQIRGDLDWIVMKCLEKDRARRYDTANALVMEIQRYLNHEPVTAGPPSRAYRVKKFVRRYRAAVLSGSVIALLLLGSSIGMTSLYLRAEAQRCVAEISKQRANEEAARAEQEAEAAHKERDKTEKFAQFMEQTLEGVGPAVALGRDTKIVKELMDAAARRIDDGELATTPAAEFRLRDCIGEVYMDIAEYDAADRMMTPMIALAKRMYGADSLEFAMALDSHASWLHALGRFTEGLGESVEALAIYRRLYLGDHQLVIAALNRVGNFHISLGKPIEALPLHEEALAMSRRLYPSDHLDLATSWTKLANCQLHLGRFSEALVGHTEALNMYRRLFPTDHPDVAVGLKMVGFSLVSLGRPAEALPIYQEALAMRRRLFPNDHPRVVETLFEIANCLNILGRPAEALPHLEGAVAMCRRLFPGDHQQTATGLSLVATSLASSGRPAEALPHYEESVAMFQRLFHEDHPQVAWAIGNLASGLSALERTAEALPMFEEALAMRRRLVSGDHPDIAGCLNNIGFCLTSLGRSAEALPKYEEALTMYGRVLPADHFRVRVAQIGKGSALVALERYAEAQDVLISVWGAVADRADVPKKNKIHCLEALIKLYDALEVTEPSQGHKETAAAYRVALESLK